MDARTLARYDQEDARTVATVRAHGWLIQYVGGDGCPFEKCDCRTSGDPAFAYTIGLHGLAHPELLIFGVDQGTAAGVLNTLGERIRSGDALMPGEMITFEEWLHRVVPEVVPNPGDIVLSANHYYCRPDEHSVAVLQLTYDDTEGRFPWDEGYAAPEMQPRPGTFRA